jgi:hypothetical protein
MPRKKSAKDRALTRSATTLFAPNLSVSTSACCASHDSSLGIHINISTNPLASRRLNSHSHRRHNTPRHPPGACFTAAASYSTRTFQQAAKHHVHRHTSILVAQHVSASAAPPTPYPASRYSTAGPRLTHELQGDF